MLLDGVIFGKLGAADDALSVHQDLLSDPAFTDPVRWGEVEPAELDGLLLPGGHAPGMRQYLGSEALQAKVVEHWRLGLPVGAICHGVLVLARAVDPETGKSVLASSRTTCLPKYMERLAHALTFWKLGRYYRTYPAFVQDEVTAALVELFTSEGCSSCPSAASSRFEAGRGGGAAGDRPHRGASAGSCAPPTGVPREIAGLPLHSRNAPRVSGPDPAQSNQARNHRGNRLGRLTRGLNRFDHSAQRAHVSHRRGIPA